MTYRRNVENFIPLQYLLNSGDGFINSNGMQLIHDIVEHPYYYKTVPMLDISQVDRDNLVFKDIEFSRELLKVYDFKKELQYYNLNKQSLENIYRFLSYLDENFKNRAIQNLSYFSDKKNIVGIGINGLQISSIAGEDIRLIRDVLKAGKTYSSYASISNKEQKNALNFSIKSILGWKNINVSCTAIGSTVDIITLMSHLLFMPDGSNNINNYTNENRIAKLVSFSKEKYANFLDNYIRSLICNFITDINENSINELFSYLNGDDLSLNNICNFTIDSSVPPVSEINYRQTIIEHRKYIVLITYAAFNQLIKNIIIILKNINSLYSNSSNNSIKNIERSIENTEKQFNLMICSFLIEHFELSLDTPELKKPFIEETLSGYKFVDNLENLCKKNSRNYNKLNLLFCGDTPNNRYSFAKNILGTLNNKIFNFLSSYSGRYNNQIFGIGSIVRNRIIFDNTCKVVKSYCNKVVLSKEVLISFLKNRMELATSGIRIVEIQSKYNTIKDYLDRIRLNSNESVKRTICLELIELLKEEYTSYRASELTYSDEDIVFKLKGKSRYNNTNNNIKSDDFKIIDHKRIYFGLSAVFLRVITTTVFQFFDLEYDTQSDLCNGLLSRIFHGYELIDQDIEEKFRKIIAQKINKLKIEENAKNYKHLTNLISETRFPTISNELSGEINTQLSKIVKFTPASFSSMSSMPRESRSGTKLTKLQMKNIIKSDFWKQLKNLNRDKGIYLPIASNTSNGRFSSSNFYLLDVLGTCISGRGMYGITNLYKLRDHRFKGKIRGGYTFFTDSHEDLADPKKWRYLESNYIKRLHSLGITKFRIAMFNFLVNSNMFKQYANKFLLETYAISRDFQTACSFSWDKKKTTSMRECPLIMSRQLFGQNIQNKAKDFSMLKGIDFSSGQTMFSINEFSAIKVNNHIRKGN